MLLVGMFVIQLLWRAVWSSLKNLELDLLFGAATTLWIYIQGHGASSPETPASSSLLQLCLQKLMYQVSVVSVATERGKKIWCSHHNYLARRKNQILHLQPSGEKFTEISQTKTNTTYLLHMWKVKYNSAMVGG